MALANIADMVNGHQMTVRPRSNAVLHRDAALARIGRARRWLIAGAAGLTGAVAAFVSATAHGHTLHKGAVVPAPARTTGSSSTSVRMPPLASASSLGLQGPAQDPQSSSGGSGSSSPQSQAPAAPAPSPTPTPAPSGPVVSGGS
jgi:hypothetical protein